MTQLSEQELAMLSDEEIAAMEADDDEAVQTDVDDEGDEDNTDVGAPSDTDDDQPSEEDTTAEVDDGAASDDDQDQAPVTDSSFTPKFRVEVPEDSAQQLTALNDQIKALGTQLEEGDLTIGEYNQQMQALTDQKVELIAVINQAKTADMINRQTAEQRWSWTQEQFFSSPANAGYQKSEVLYSALDAAVKEVARDPKFTDANDAQVLAEADRRVREVMIVPGSKAQVSASEGKQKIKVPAADLSGIPKTLGAVPAAQEPDTGSGEFAALDKLEGLDFERALAKLSPDQQARYLAEA